MTLENSKKPFVPNWKFYLMEALGLAFFMMSCCYWGTMLESPKGFLHPLITNGTYRLYLMAFFMASTAGIIFYCPLTYPSGAHINPAVTITFYRLGKISIGDTLFYILFQFIGGTAMVYFMGFLLGDLLTSPPVGYLVTKPGKYGIVGAAITEYTIAFVMITMILFTSAHPKLSKLTKVFACFLVASFVVVAGPISGFGMNPARSFATAMPANYWESYWIYLCMPILGMLSAAEFYVQFNKRGWVKHFHLHHLSMYLPHNPFNYRKM